LLKFALPILSWGIFIFIVFNIPYPDSLAQANLMQAALFFGSLFLGIALTLNIFLINILMSFAISLCLIFLLILKALDSLSIVTGVLLLISAGLLFSYFKKNKRNIGAIRGIRGIRGIKGNK
ncbi:MAG: hypothetical protein Q7R43_06090, partial [Candidatus Daviesbacteria bacterium]|nr:hypothetical protein [Candidatus Daviesbacteria bacterium]